MWLKGDNISSWSRYADPEIAVRKGLQKGALKSFEKFTTKHQRWSLIFKFSGFQLAAFNFIKKDTPAQVFPCKYGEFLWMIFFMQILQAIVSVDMIKILGG